MKRLLFLCIAAMIGNTAYAVSSDASQPTKIEADQMVYDNAKQMKTFTGNVILTRGTLLIKAGKVVLVTSPAGYEQATLYATPGQLASLRQQRDGGPDLWIEGEAERIEYDERTEIAKLFSKAKMRRLSGKNTTDEITGEFITYDSGTEVYSAQNNNPDSSSTGGKRVTAIIQPRANSTKD